MNRIFVVLFVLALAFACGVATAQTPACTAAILRPTNTQQFRTGGALTYPVYFSSHHTYMVTNPPPVLYLDVSGTADLKRDAQVVGHADLPSQMTVSDWPNPATGYLDLYGTVNVYLGGHYGSAASSFAYNMAQANASQQISFSVTMY